MKEAIIGFAVDKESGGKTVEESECRRLDQRLAAQPNDLLKEVFPSDLARIFHGAFHVGARLAERFARKSYRATSCAPTFDPFPFWLQSKLDFTSQAHIPISTRLSSNSTKSNEICGLARCHRGCESPFDKLRANGLIPRFPRPGGASGAPRPAFSACRRAAPAGCL
jgi:hypothetical protein